MTTQTFDIANHTHRPARRQPGTEAQLQRACAQYLDYLQLLWFHPPNGGNRNYITAAKMKGEGVKPGVSDVVILEPRGGKHGLMVELKVGSNRVSNEQLAFLYRAWKKGYSIAVCYTFDTFKQVVDAYLEGPQHHNTTTPQHP